MGWTSAKGMVRHITFLHTTAELIEWGGKVLGVVAVIFLYLDALVGCGRRVFLLSN